jgi:hypothetical protein
VPTAPEKTADAPMRDSMMGDAMMSGAAPAAAPGSEGAKEGGDTMMMQP